MIIIYWWLCEVEPSPKISKKKKQSEKINPRTNLMEYADMKSLLNLSQVWFNQQSFSLYYQTFYMFY